MMTFVDIRRKGDGYEWTCNCGAGRSFHRADFVTDSAMRRAVYLGGKAHLDRVHSGQGELQFAIDDLTPFLEIKKAIDAEVGIGVTDRWKLSAECIATEVTLMKGDIRMGQQLFNKLPAWAQEVVRGTLFDPFYTLSTAGAVTDWVSSHVIFDDNDMLLAVFNNSKILAQRPGS